MLVGCLGLACAPPKPDPSRSPGTPQPESVVHVDGGEGRISGQLIDTRKGEPLARGLILATCPCLEEKLELMNDEQGRFAFEGLPPGSYTVQALHGQSQETRTVELLPGEDAWVGIAADSQQTEHFCLEVDTQPRSAHCPY